MADGGTRDRIIQLHDTAIDRPYPEQIAPLERAVELADELGDEGLGIAVRLALVSALVFGGRFSGAFVPFAWLVQRYDAGSPALTDRYRHGILWRNKWIVDNAASYPQIPLAQIEALLADMKRRYAAAGVGPEPVAKCVYEFVSATRGDDAAGAEFAAWTVLPPCDMSDCRACSSRSQARYWHNRGQHERALELLAPVLRGESACAEEPGSSLGLAAQCAAELGRMDEAAAYHMRGWRECRDNIGLTGGVPGHVLLCARTGALARGLELLAHRWEQVREFDKPLTRMHLQAAAARLVGACLAGGMRGQRLLTRTGEELVIDQGLYDELTGRALGAAAAFDARNGNGSESRFLRRAYLDAGPLPPMPLTTGVADPHRGEPLNGLSSHPLAVGLEEIATAPLEDLRGLFERVIRWGGCDAAAALEARWRALRAEAIARAETSGDTERLGLVADFVAAMNLLTGRARESQRLEAAETGIRLLEQAGDAVSVAAIQHRLALDIAHDEERAAALAEQVRSSGDIRPILQIMGDNPVGPDDPAAVRTRLGELESLGVAPGSEPLVRYRWAHLVLDCCSGPGPGLAMCERVEGLLLPEEFPELRARICELRAGALWEQGRRDEATAVVDAAIGYLTRAGALNELGRMLLRQRGRIHQVADDQLGAERCFQRAIACAQHTGNLPMLTDARGALCALLFNQGRAIEAIEVAEHALADLEIPDDPYAGWSTRAMMDSRAQIASMAARLCRGLGETGRAVSLARRGADDAIRLGRPAVAAGLLGIAGDGLCDSDAVEALRAYTQGVEQARAADDPVELLELQRRRMWAAAGADGLDAGLAVHAEAVAAGRALCERAFVDAEFAERTNIDREMTMLDVSVDRVRLLATHRAYDRALSELGDAPETILARGDTAFAASIHDLRARIRLAVDDERGGFADIGAAMGLADRLGDSRLRGEFAALGANWLESEGRGDEAERFWTANNGRQEG
ncbi:hypothetical protein [uncultured Propionibacterium sp.]|uniref:hypothetical protein n=1 Tax=uncultured Propionibacterium sp. TaxID=218066 RepID=UPI0029317777|nr:hypothetical protein [uncultured Propionibacterium sp.]